MSVSLHDGLIILSGLCGVEEAETLASLLEAHPHARVDLSGAGQVHTALWQVLILARPTLLGEPANAFYRDWIVPAIAAASDETTT